jgi:hypothetical protein
MQNAGVVGMHVQVWLPKAWLLLAGVRHNCTSFQMGELMHMRAQLTWKGAME